MRIADRLLEDEALLDHVYDAQAKRHRQSRTRGRKQTPAEVVVGQKTDVYFRVAGQWTYLYRAVDSTGATIDFLSRRRCVLDLGRARRSGSVHGERHAARQRSRTRRLKDAERQMSEIV